MSKVLIVRYVSPDRDVPENFAFVRWLQDISREFDGRFRVQGTSSWSATGDLGSGFQSEEVFVIAEPEVSESDIRRFRDKMNDRLRGAGVFEPHDGPSAFRFTVALLIG